MSMNLTNTREIITISQVKFVTILPVSLGTTNN